MRTKKRFIKIFVAACLFTLATSAFIPPPTSIPYFYGEFKIKKIMNYYDSLSTPIHYMAYSNLYSDSIYYSQSWKANSYGNVYYNNIGLNYNSTIRTYMDTVSSKVNSSIIWSVSQSSVCGSFTTTLIDSFPNFTFKNCLPSSLSKSKPFHISVNNCIYSDEVEITMHDGQFRTSVPFYRRIRTQRANQITIPKKDLTSLTGQGITVTVSLIKYEYKRINGKNFKFEKRFDFVRPMPLIN